jgi:transcriptional regulator with XRE-family HTH domain
LLRFRNNDGILYINSFIKGVVDLLGANIKKLRTEHRLTLEQLAEILNNTYPGTVNFNKGKLSKWENNREEPKLSSIRIIADFFKVTVDELSSDNFQVSSPSIAYVYDQLNLDRQKKVYNYAEEQLEDQNKIIRFTKANEIIEDDLAAHLVDPEREFTDQEIDDLKEYLNKAKKEYFEKRNK